MTCFWTLISVTLEILWAILIWSYIPLICHNSLVPQKTETLRKRFYCLVPGGFY